MSQSKLHPEYLRQKALQDAYLVRKNKKTDFYNGIYDRWENPVLTRESIPLSWRFDLNPETNPHFMERLGVNAVFNSGAIKLNGKYYLVARIEGNDRKSFFGVAESDSPVEGFHFWEKPILLPDTCPEETNVYDMRLTQHEDGWIYGVFCSESKDTSVNDLSAAVAAAGIVRTKDLKTWERLPNLVTKRSPQQRNVDLLPEFVNGKYAFYTRPMDDFIDTGSGGGVGFGLCEDITHAVIDEEIITSPRRYHTITEAKNGEGATPIKTEKGWLHIAHGVRNTAAGLRYVIYVFVTALDDPSKVIAEPSGFLIAPRDWERVGDVSNVVFTKGNVMKKANIDSPFYRTMGRIGDLVLANVLWLVCCLPILTAGASTLGLFTVVNKMAAKEDYTVRTDFFKAFKRDFKQSTALWLVLLLAGFAALTGLRTATAQDTAGNGILAAASFLLLVLAGCCGSWGFALLARFTYPGVLPVLADSGRMTLANLLPTVGNLAFLAWFPLLAKAAPAWFVYLLPLWLLIGGAGSALGMASLMRPAFAQLEKAGRKEEEPEEETDTEDSTQ